MNEVKSRIEDYIQTYVDRFNLPGMSFAITDRNDLLHTFHYGYANLEEKKKIDPETRFYIASIGKTFTSVALLRLMNFYGIDLHAPVQRYLPWFEAGSNIEGIDKEITLHHLLTHTSGLQRGTDFAPSSPYEVYALRNAKIRVQPGKMFHYSNVGYKLVGYVLEHISGKPYQQLINETVLTPLGMDKSLSCITHSIRDVLAVGYETRFDDRPYFFKYPLDPAPRLELNTGDGCIATTVEDLCKFIRMLLNRGETPSGRFMSEDSIDLMFNRRVENTFNNENLAYGYGITIESGRQFGHGGDAPGFKSCYMADPESGYGVAVFSNGPLLTTNVAYFAIDCLKAHTSASELPNIPRFDPTFISEFGDYEGTYVFNDKSFILFGDKDKLIFSDSEGKYPLRKRKHDCFLMEHPEFLDFLLEVVREQGVVVGILHGSKFFVKRGHESRAHACSQLDAFVGHYVAYNPWLSNFRIVMRLGGLVLIEPQGNTYSLVATDNQYVYSVFEEDVKLPEWIEFDPPINNQTLKLSYSGCDYYRGFLY